MNESNLRAKERLGLWAIVTTSLVPLIPCLHGLIPRRRGGESRLVAPSA